MHRLRLLFVCTGNSARSQMAEGVAKTRGIRAHPLATRVMTEKGIENWLLPDPAKATGSA